MSGADHPEYDAIIIGAGISGLVCGNYLAKAGMKVLIAEQHHKPGGYCTSFTRRGFTFDAAAHSFGGYRENGILRKVFQDFSLDKNIPVTRYDPSDILLTPEYRVCLWSDPEKTIEDLREPFPKEADTYREFVAFLMNPTLNSFARMRSWTFKDLLDHYFQNEALKSMLAFPIFGNGALPPSRMSAFIGAKIFIEFLLDGGYYPDGGMHVMSNALAGRFQEYGGELLLSSPVQKIIVRNGNASGVVINNTLIASRHVISNCDARQTFLNLVGKKHLPQEFLNKLTHMIPSLSMFVLYLGMDQAFPENAGSNIWYLPQYDLENMYRSATRRSHKNISEFMMRISPNGKCILAFIHAPYRNKPFWLNNREKFIESFILHLTHIMPDIAQHILYKEAATPHTMHRYTLNYRGAAYGWESIHSQLADVDFRRPSFLHNLSLTGHWSTQGLGIPGVAYLGYDTASTLLKRRKTLSS
jgi:phytoene dehydrogenase-like protein